MKNTIDILVGTALNIWIALGSMGILMMVILPILEHLFLSSLIYFFSVLKFSEYKSFPSLVRFIPRYLILLEVFVNKIVVLISLSVSSFLAYKMQLMSAHGFCILLLC